MANYIVLNGNYIRKEDAKLSTDNRSFKYGDGLFETMHANGRQAQFLDKHLERLLEGMDKLKMNIPANFTNNYFETIIASLLARNKQYKGARIRLSVFRNDGGLYTPLTNDISFIIESESLEYDIYTLNKTGLNIDIFKEIPKTKTYFSSIKSANSLPFIMAGIFKTENNLDDCILINDSGEFIESISSNIFIIKNNKISTPSLEKGCIPGIMRNEIISLSKKLGYTINDNASLSEKDLIEADEVFLTNAINGIRWVVGFKSRRYFNIIAKKLISELNKTLFLS